MATINVTTSGDIPKAWKNNGGQRPIYKMEECYAMRKQIRFVFNGEDYTFEETDTLNVNGSPVAGNAEAKAAAIQDALKSFFPKAPGTGSGGGGAIGDVMAFASRKGFSLSSVSDANSKFLVFGVGTIRPTGTIAHGNTITWQLLDDADHNPMFFNSAGTVASGRVQAGYPTVKKVLGFKCGPDEILASGGVICGASVGLSAAEIELRRSAQASVRLVGAGTTTWAKNEFGSFTIGAFNTSTGETLVTCPPAVGGSVYSSVVVYQGSNNYNIRRVYSGLGNGQLKFILQDGSGNPVLTAPTSSDNVVIFAGGITTVIVDARTYSTTEGTNTAALFLLTSNIWIEGIFEAWLVATPVSQNKVLVYWQTDYPSATNFKIYRDTASNFATQQLVHTGSEGEYTDTSLTGGTEYYYKLVAVVGGVDTTVTTFRTKTT
ncbi:MAG: hypothetical protein ACTHLE_04215 [Agriterribacter sp.]